MKREDRQLLFTALGFMAVVMQRGTMTGDGAARAQGFAILIEEFCRTAVPEAFDPPEEPLLGQSESDVSAA